MVNTNVLLDFFMSKSKEKINLNLIKLKGFSSLNTSGNYSESKQPAPAWNWDSPFSIDEALAWDKEAGGNGIGLRIPISYIVLDVDNPKNSSVILEGLCHAGYRFIGIKTPNGGQFIFKDNNHAKITQTDGFISIAGIAPVGFRLCAGRSSNKGGYIVLPTNNTEGRAVVYIPNTTDDLDDLPLCFLPVRRATEDEKTKQLSFQTHPGRHDFLKDIRNKIQGFNGSHHLGLSKDEKFTVLREVNSIFCVPPKDIKELKDLDSWSEKNLLNDKPTLNLTDTGNGKRLISKFGTHVHFIGEYEKWYIWTGKRWKLDLAHYVEYMGKETITELINKSRVDLEITTKEISLFYEKNPDAKKPPYDLLTKFKKAEDNLKFFLKSENHYGLTSMIKCALSEPGIAITTDILDNHPLFFNTLSGTINLETMELLPHNPLHLITKVAPVKYDPKAECPLWEAFLFKIMAGNLDLIRYLRRVVGYSLSGITTEHHVNIFYGTGRNGKSTFLNMVRSLLGDYAAHAQIETFAFNKYKGGNDASNDLACLKGSRFVSATEANEGLRLSEGLVKQASGGDPIKTRFNYGLPFEYKPEFKIVMAFNNKPIIYNVDYAMRERIHLVPFSVTIPPAERDKDLENKLRQELSGILNWALTGFKMWTEVGLKPPDIVKTATEEYMNEQDFFNAFVKECCNCDDPKYDTPSKDIFDAFNTWAAENVPFTPTQHWIGKQLKKMGMKQVKIKKDGLQIRGWRGLRLNEEEIPF